MIKLAIFASGNGTNAEEIIKYFAKNEKIEVALVLSNNANAYVLERATHHKIPTQTFTYTDLKQGTVLEVLKDHQIDFVILAGFMLLVPDHLIRAYTHKIINIHPALLPKYGGKGMFGEHVHKAVKANDEKETGITIHYVNENYDEGEIIFQESCEVSANDTPASIASKVHKLEYAHYPRIIEEVIEKMTDK